MLAIVVQQAVEFTAHALGAFAGAARTRLLLSRADNALLADLLGRGAALHLQNVQHVRHADAGEAAEGEERRRRAMVR